MNPGGSQFNVPYAFRVRGDLDIAALSQAMGEIRKRHAILRTVFRDEDGKISQVTQAATDYSIPVVDLSNFPLAEREDRVSSKINEEARQPFDLAHGPLVRSELLRLDHDEHVFLVTFHHIVFDAWSDGIFFKELDVLYDAFRNGNSSPLNELPIQYSDFAFWQHEWIRSGALDVLLKFWSRSLTEVPAQTFPTDFPRPIKPSGHLGRKTLLFPKELCDSLKALIAEEGVTEFILFLAAFKVLLHTYLEQNDVYVCAPIANRSRGEIQKMIGYFVNFVLYRTDFSGDVSFRDLLTTVCKVSSEVYSHQEMPIQELVDRLNLHHLPLSQIMFSVQNAGRHEPKLGGLSVSPLDEQRGVDFDIFLEIETQQEGVLLNLRYNTDLFKHSSMEALIDDYQTILKTAVSDPDQAVATLLPITEERRLAWHEKRAAEADRQASKASAGSYVAPRDRLELQLAQIWEDLLARRPIGVTDNFFELGGKSLLALQMVAQIEERIGKALPVSTLAEAQSIEEIATLLRQDQTLQSSSSVVALQPRGSRPPLFLLQPAACTELHFVDLARRLAPDQPVYGFIQRGMDGKNPPHNAVEEMAAFYIGEMKTVWPQGPYLLMGRCMGGVVAYEMALQLQAQNETIAFLGILDTQSPPRLEGRDATYYAVELFSRLFHYIKSGTLVRATFGRFLRKAKRRQSKDAADRTTQHVMDTHARARRHYVPARQYQGVLKIFKNKEASLAAQARWARLATQGLDFIETAGHHGSMLEEEHIEEFLDALKSVLNQSLDFSGESPSESDRHAVNS